MFVMVSAIFVAKEFSPRIVSNIQEFQSISICNQHLCCRQKLVHIRLVSLIGSSSFNVDENCKTARNDQVNHECVNTWSIGLLECSWSVFEPVWSRFFKIALVCKDFWVRQYHKSLFLKWTSIVHSKQEFENIFWLKNYLRINFPKKGNLKWTKKIRNWMKLIIT